MAERKRRKLKRIKKKAPGRKRWYWAGAAVCGVILLAAVFFMAVYVGKQRRAEEAYEAMQSAREEVPEPVVEEPVEPIAEEPVEEYASDAPHLENTIDFASLHETNEDIYAWIQIPGTLVDYPILQHPEDDAYYLDHTVEHASGLPGSIYTESIHPKDFSAPMTVIYGHNMRNDTMFGSLHDYEEADKLTEAPYVYIYLPERTLVYQVFAAVRFSDAYLPVYCDYEDEEAFLSFIEELCTSPGNVNEEVEVPFGSRIVVLSTCIGNAPSNRFLVAAVQIDEYEK